MGFRRKPSTPSPGDEPTPARRRRPVRWLLRQAEHLLAAFGLVTLVYLVCFDVSRITSPSMSPTLQGESWDTGDVLLSEKVSYYFRRPRRWDVMTLRSPTGKQVAKRVIGLPGESVQMLRGGRILIDGREIHPPAKLEFLEYFPFGNLTAGATVDCGDGYYVLGDDSKDSDDSRFNGPVPPEEITGRAWFILAPAERRQFVNHGG